MITKSRVFALGLILSLLVRPEVITLSGFYCNCKLADDSLRLQLIILIVKNMTLKEVFVNFKKKNYKGGNICTSTQFVFAKNHKSKVDIFK